MAADKLTTVYDFLNNNGFGIFSYKLSFILSMFWFIDGAEMTISTLIGPYLKCEWGMPSFITALMSAFVFIGMGFGSTYWGILGDINGRKPMFLFGLIMTVYFSLLNSFSSGPIWFSFTRFFVGVGATGALVNSATITNEYISNQHRGKINILQGLMFSLGCVYVGFVGYVTLNNYGWRIFLICISLPFVSVIFISMWIPESILYLQTIGKYTKIIEIVQWITQQEKKDLPANIVLQTTKSVNKVNVRILFNKRYRWTTVPLLIVWIVSSTSYYACIFLTIYKIREEGAVCQEDQHIRLNSTLLHENSKCKKLTDEEYLKNIYVILGEIPALFIYLFAIDIVGRKYTLMFGLAYSAFLFLMQNICLPKIVAIIILFTGRGIILATYQILCVYTCELYPTAIRASALGLCSSFSKCFLVFVPFLMQQLIYTSMHAVTFLYFGLNILGFLCCLTLTETLGVHLI